MEITDLKPYLQNALHSKGINTLSEVQQCMEDILKNEDVCVISPTGSGKTLSYVLPVLQKLEIQTTKKHLPFALILVPTRELALQVAFDYFFRSLRSGYFNSHRVRGSYCFDV